MSPFIEYNWGLQGIHFFLTFALKHRLWVLVRRGGSYMHPQLSRDVRKPDFCICENKDADQLRGNREADQRLCFRHLDSKIPLLSKSEISSL